MKINSYAFLFAASVAAALSLHALEGQSQSTQRQPQTGASQTQTGGAPTQTSAGQQAAGGQTTADPAAAQVLADIHHANEMEIKMGKLAKDRGQSEAIKNYGDRLIRDHESAEERTKEVAKTLNVKLPDMDDAMKQKHDATERQLKALKGAEFDRSFAKKMAEEHQKTINKLQQAQGTLSASPVKDLVTQLLPTLQEHQRIANDLANQFGGKSGQRS